MERKKKGENRDTSIGLSRLSKDEDFIGLSELYNRLKLKYGKLEILSTLEEEIFIPTSIFSKKLGSLEAISKYLFENKNLSLKIISKLLNRSNRNIWNAYNNSKKKFSEKLMVKESILIPVSICKNLDYTLLENIVSYLKDKCGLSYHKTALLLKRDDRTIWTVYNRAKKKQR
jgi:hypothetical protein